jgi:hypothetical protein
MSAALAPIFAPLKRPKQGRRSNRTPGKRKAVLAALRRGHGFHTAAEIARMSYRSLCEWRADDQAFATECEEAADYCKDASIQELWRRGMDSDTLALLAWLRAHAPEKFHRKMLVALGGDPEAPPIGIAASTDQAWIFPVPEMDRPLPDDGSSKGPKQGPVIEGQAIDGDPPQTEGV